MRGDERRELGPSGLLLLRGKGPRAAVREPRPDARAVLAGLCSPRAAPSGAGFSLPGTRPAASVAQTALAVRG